MEILVYLKKINWFTLLRLSEGLNFCWFLKLNFSICQPAINQNFHRPHANYTEITIIKCALVFRFNHPFCFLVRPNDFVEAKLRYTHFIVLITCYCGWLGDSVSLNLRSPELFSWAASLHPFVRSAPKTDKLTAVCIFCSSLTAEGRKDSIV